MVCFDFKWKWKMSDRKKYVFWFDHELKLDFKFTCRDFFKKWIILFEGLGIWCRNFCSIRKWFRNKGDDGNISSWWYLLISSWKRKEMILNDKFIFVSKYLMIFIDYINSFSYLECKGKISVLGNEIIFYSKVLSF